MNQPVPLKRDAKRSTAYRTVDDFLDLVAARQRHGAASRKAHQLRAEIADCKLRIRQRGPDERSGAAVLAAAERMLEGGPIPDPPRTEQEQLAKLLREIDIAATAVGIARRQVEELEGEARHAMMLERRPEHGRHVARIAAALRALSDAIVAENKFVAEAHAAGLTGFEMALMAFPGVGNWRVHGTRAFYWFEEMRNRGFPVDAAPAAAAE